MAMCRDAGLVRPCERGCMTLLTAAPTLLSVDLPTGPRLNVAVQGEPDAEPIVFLHGFTDSWFSFSRILPMVRRDRFRAIVPDQRGHGDSCRPLVGYDLEDFAAD